VRETALVSALSVAPVICIPASVSVVDDISVRLARNRNAQGTVQGEDFVTYSQASAGAPLASQTQIAALSGALKTVITKGSVLAMQKTHVANALHLSLGNLVN